MSAPPIAEARPGDRWQLRGRISDKDSVVIEATEEGGEVFVVHHNRTGRKGRTTARALVASYKLVQRDGKPVDKFSGTADQLVQWGYITQAQAEALAKVAKEGLVPATFGSRLYRSLSTLDVLGLVDRVESFDRWCLTEAGRFVTRVPVKPLDVAYDVAPGSEATS